MSKRLTRAEQVSRLEDLYIPEPNSGCWLWLLAMKGSYGGMWLEGKYLNAHRAFWILLRGEIPSRKIFVLHKCDNRLCVNPDHMFLGTNSDNMKDAASKGRLTNWKSNFACNHRAS